MIGSVCEYIVLDTSRSVYCWASSAVWCVCCCASSGVWCVYWCASSAVWRTRVEILSRTIRILGGKERVFVGPPQSWKSLYLRPGIEQDFNGTKRNSTKLNGNEAASRGFEQK